MSKRSPFLAIFLIVLVDIFGLTLVIPLLAIYAERFHATPLEATLLISVFAACQLFSGPLLGQISDRVGRKPMLLVSQVGTFIGFIVLARAQALWMIYLSRMIDGATAGNISLAQAYISDNTEPHERARAFGFIGIAFGLGFFIGPFVTGYLSGYGLTAPIYLAACMSATSILCTATLLPSGLSGRARESAARGEPGPGGRRLGVLQWSTYVQYFRRPVLAGLLVQFFCYIFAFSTFNSGFALFAERRFAWHGVPFGPKEIGYLFAYSGLIGIVLQGGFIGRLVRRFGEPALVASGFVTLAASYVALGMVHSVGGLLAVATVSSYGNGVERPALTSLVTQRAGPNEQGLLLGLMQSLNSTASILAPTLGGWLIGRHELLLWAIVPSIASGAGLLAARWGSARVVRHEPHATA